MTITRVKPLGWAFGELLTAAQMNQLDIDHANAMDGAAGGTYTAPFILSDVTMGGTTKLKLASRSLTRVMAAMWTVKTAADWTLPDGSGLITTTNTNSTPIYKPLDLPNGCTMTSVSVWIKPAGGHGALPASKPGLGLFKVSAATGVSTLITSMADAPASVPAYETRHTLDLSGLTEVIDKTAFQYFIQVFPEFGANAVAGAAFDDAVAVFTTTAQDDGAA